MLSDEWLERYTYPLRETLTENFDKSSTNVTESNKQTNEHMNGQTESYITLGINAGGITTRNHFFY